MPSPRGSFSNPGKIHKPRSPWKDAPFPRAAEMFLMVMHCSLALLAGRDLQGCQLTHQVTVWQLWHQGIEAAEALSLEQQCTGSSDWLQIKWQPSRRHSAPCTEFLVSTEMSENSRLWVLLWKEHRSVSFLGTEEKGLPLLCRFHLCGWTAKEQQGHSKLHQFHIIFFISPDFLKISLWHQLMTGYSALIKFYLEMVRRFQDVNLLLNIVIWGSMLSCGSGLGSTSLLQPHPCSAAQVCCGKCAVACMLSVFCEDMNGHLCLVSNRWGLR